ncbi:MAG: transglycosylase domain-containing protein, partial [Nocardioidaceae bacterium]
MSSKQPPPSGEPGRRAASTGVSTSAPAASSGATSSKSGRAPTGSGKGGKVKARDLKGWPKTRHVAKKTAKWGAIVGFTGALLGAIAVYVTYKMIDIPDPNKDFQTQTTTVYFSDGKHVIGQFALQNRESIPLDEMPDSLQQAVISAEDRSFETNAGLDPKGIVRAAWSNLRSDSGTQGASTITQQYVKVLYLSQERTYTRKIREAFLAVKVQNTLSKDEILEGYLNTIYFGRGAYGIEAASKAYFERPAKDLTVPQSAVLAAVLNSPATLDPAVAKRNREPLRERYRHVLAGMVEAGDLDSTKAQKYKRRLPRFPPIEEFNQYGGQRGYLLTLVQSELIKLDFSQEEINGGGLKVTTTIDWQDHRAAVTAVSEVRPPKKPQLHVALASVEPGSGALRAMIGGRNFTGAGPQDQVNFATSGGQAGSTFKPFALTAALKDGFTLSDTLDGDSPYVYSNGEQVVNEGESSGQPDGFDYGTVDLTEATAESINTAYIDLTVRMGAGGPDRIVDASVDAGIPRSSPGLDPYSRVALGSASIQPVEMAEAYATFATEGEHADWYIIEEVGDSGGTRYEHEAEVSRVFSFAVASNVSYALQQVVEEGTGQNALALDRPAAGKTGTATNADGDVSSSWFVGYTPQLSTAVMLVRGTGNEALNGYLDTFYGANYPTETWTAYMKLALTGEPVQAFPEPGELRGKSPTYSPPQTTYSPPPTTYSPPPTTYSPPSTTKAPPTTSAPPPTSSPPPTSAPPPT